MHINYTETENKKEKARYEPEESMWDTVYIKDVYKQIKTSSK